MPDERDIIAAIWMEWLPLMKDPSGEDFFEMGGSSLSLVTMLVEIQERFGVEIDVDPFLETPTIETLTGLVVAAREDLKITE